MNRSSKISLMGLQHEMQKELEKMSFSLKKSQSVDLRHTVSGSTEKQLKSTIDKIRALKSSSPLSERKREYSLTSTKILETNNSPILQNIRSADRLDRGQEFGQAKLSAKTKLKKKLSKQDSPKPFIKLKRE